MTISRLLGFAGCFALCFAATVYIESFGWWLLCFSIPPILAGIIGTSKNGIAGFLEGAVLGALLLPLYLLLVTAAVIVCFPISLIFQSFFG